MEDLNHDDSFESVSMGDLFERLILLPIGDTVHEEARKFIYEALSILERCQSKKAKSVPLTVHSRDKISTHLILYEFIALSLVRKAETDVAATAIYQKGDMWKYCGSRILWTKRDEEHTEDFANLIRTTAADPSICLHQFHLNYFSFVI